MAYYFNYELQDTFDVADDADDGSTDRHRVEDEALSAPLYAELDNSESLQSAGVHNLPDLAQLSGFSSVDRNQPTSESVEVANLVLAADEPVRH